MNFEALLLGIEPVTALAVGVGAAILAPVANAVGSAVQDSKLGDSLSESARDLVKNGLVWGFEAFENAQTTFASAEESFRDLVADAKVEQMVNKSKSETAEPQVIEIVSH